ncbi:tripartite tricarboxylate transporter substrate binding protein [Variovorax sp. 38R]|uniref:tripartite tricarboxylate transporter substrate binding protein n=1 Tax=Variovorax sp. 38R TaxID=2774875 RepID=UPI0017856EA2|nr:tripartite tricarboxylate transporter substrate binding protein [Variovorax sp. 38R]QOF77578.1 tripartite tricarboxylate transporter substrate binding protein [Variovorax sp. 38R]
MPRRTRLLAAALLCAAAFHGHAAPPEAYPNKPVTVVVPYPAGGSVDAMARALHVALGKQLGQPVLIENLGGGAGAIGAAKVVRARADGYTLLLGSVNEVVLAPLTNSAVSYKSDDLTPVARVGDSTFILVGRPGIAARNTDDLIEFARKNPGTLSYATSGVGTLQHVIMRDIQERSGTSMLHVPYKGGSTQVTDLLGGQVDLMLVAPATFPDAIESGRVRGFGTTGLQREELLKNVPTLNESKYLKGIDLNSWLGIFVPRNTPPEVTQRLQVAIGLVLGDAKVAAHLKRIGFTPADAGARPGFAEVVADTQSKMQGVVSRMPAEKSEVTR